MNRNSRMGSYIRDGLNAIFEQAKACGPVIKQACCWDTRARWRTERDGVPTPSPRRCIRLESISHAVHNGPAVDARDHGHQAPSIAAHLFNQRREASPSVEGGMASAGPWGIVGVLAGSTASA
jgi:hypothetical protein